MIYAFAFDMTYSSLEHLQFVCLLLLAQIPTVESKIPQEVQRRLQAYVWYVDADRSSAGCFRQIDIAAFLPAELNRTDGLEPAIALFSVHLWPDDMVAPQIPTDTWRLRGIIARSVGVIVIALGFIIGMYGLDHPASHWLHTALGLLVTGLVAQGYGLYCSIKRIRN